MKKHTLGIDIGSTTVKIAILDENDTLVFSDYERHFANIQETLADVYKRQFIPHPNKKDTTSQKNAVPFTYSRYCEKSIKQKPDQPSQPQQSPASS